MLLVLDTYSLILFIYSIHNNCDHILDGINLSGDVEWVGLKGFIRNYIWSIGCYSEINSIVKNILFLVEWTLAMICFSSASNLTTRSYFRLRHRESRISQRNIILYQKVFYSPHIITALFIARWRRVPRYRRHNRHIIWALKFLSIWHHIWNILLWWILLVLCRQLIPFIWLIKWPSIVCL